MSFAHIAATALLATALGLAGCGFKGDPIRPGSDEDPKRQQQSTE